MELPLFWSIGLILFVSTVVVRVAGFGGSLVSMPMLVPLITLPAAAPIMTLFGITNFSIIIGQNWQHVTIRDIWRLAVMGILLTPLGVYLIYVVPERQLRMILGIICIVYALYRFANLPFPKLQNRNWAWLFGAAAGVAAGAFSVGGVPTVIYANTQEWEPDQFRLNMFSFFLFTNSFTLITRAVAGQVTRPVLGYWLGAIPFLLLGIWVGERLALRIDKQRFQTLVLLLLVVLGARLVWYAL